MTRLRGVLVVGGALVLLGCGGKGGLKPDGGDGAGQAGTAGGAGAGAAGTTGAAGGAPDGAAPDGDAGDAPVAFICTGLGGGGCNDNPAVSSIWGVCGTDGRCQCNAGFAVNPATGKCRPAPVDAGSGATDGGDAAPLPAWQSGTRLRARLLKAAATNDAVYQNVFDKELGVACAFTKANDGAIRCMPPVGLLFFSDQGCTEPLAVVDTGCAPPTYVSRVLSCRTRAFKVGAKVVPAKIWGLAFEGSCVEQPFTGVGVRDFYPLTMVTATTFVEATELRDPRGGGLEMRYWKSDDGGLFPTGAWDPRRAASCVQGAGVYADRCIPGVVANVSVGVPYFADPQCRWPLGYVENQTCAEPASAVGVLDPSACGQSRAYAEATSYTGAAYRASTNACFATPPALDGWAFYEAGAVIPPGSLPAMTTSLQGTGRLKARRYLTSAAKPIDSRPALYDSTLQDTCIPEQTPQGLRCLPETTSAITFYADSLCTKPVFIESKTKPDPACAAPRPKIIYREKTAATCGGLPTLELFEVGATMAVPTIYLLHNGTDCIDSGLSPAANDVFSTTADASAAALAYVSE